MPQTIAAFPAIPAGRQAPTLGGDQYRMRLTWRDRTAAWYADLWTSGGTPIWLGQRVSPGWAMAMGLEPVSKPSGVFLVRGPDVYERGNLGGSLQIVYYAEAELPEPVAAADAVTVTV